MAGRDVALDGINVAVVVQLHRLAHYMTEACGLVGRSLWCHQDLGLLVYKGIGRGRTEVWAC
jgi:hypothetical protein